MNPTVSGAKASKTQILVHILGSKKLYGGCWNSPRGWRYAWGPDWGDHREAFERDQAALAKVRRAR